jgi:hypothetical protein
MAADKEIMKALETLRLDRPGRVLTAAMHGGPLGEQVGAAFAQLAATYREEAELWERSGAKGWKSSAADAAMIAQAVDAVAAQLDNAGGGAALSVSEPRPTEPIERPTDLSGLAQLIADSKAEQRGHVREGEALGVTDAQLADPGKAVGDLHDYLSGKTNDIPGTPPLTPGSVRDQTGGTDSDGWLGPLPGVTLIDNGDGSYTNANTVSVTVDTAAGTRTLAPGDTVTTGEHDTPIPRTWETETMTADGLRAPGQVPAAPAVAPMLGQPGDAGSGYSHSYVPPGGRRLTYADLLQPVAAASLPAHLSHSQIGDAGDCGVKYRAQRVELLPQVPQWANVGGSAFHAAVEAFERTVANLPHDKAQANGWKDYDVDATWRHHFEAEIDRVRTTSPVPVSLWRPSRKGAEGRQWWEVNGPLMLKRYLDARPASPSVTIDSGGTPAIEWEITTSVPTGYGPIPFVAKIDRVTAEQDGTIMIRDYKTSYERPTDTTQLGDYAHALMLSGANLHGATRIMGSYFDARRGTWTEPVDLLQAHPFDAFEYRVTAAHGQKLALTTGPTPARPSNYCGGCAVRYACPIMAAKS